MPTLSSGVAEALPGLSETLAGPPSAITTGRFFYGTQNAAGALFQSATSPTSLTTTESIAQDATSITVSSGNRTDYEAMFAATPTGQNLYFVDSTYTTAFPAAGGQILDASVNIYLVVSFDTVTYITVFGRQGYGSLNISTSTFNVDSETIKLNTIPQAVKSNFLYYDTATKQVSHNQLDVLGSANGATYDFGGNTDVPVVSIDFDNFIISAPANGIVTLKQGYTYGGALGDSGAHIAADWYYYILDNITANKSLTLPAGTVGASIKFTNLNGYNSSGVYSAPSYAWTINPNGSDKIMRASSLAVSNQSKFELFYTDAANGWVLNGNN
jgi:hypothetical protein